MCRKKDLLVIRLPRLSLRLGEEGRSKMAKKQADFVVSRVDINLSD